MKLKLLLVATLLISIVANLSAQSHVKWKYRAVRDGEKEYQILIEGTVDDGYTVSALRQPPNSIAFPLKIRFDLNKLVRAVWQDPTEIDTPILKEWNDIGLSRKYYENSINLIIPYYLLDKPVYPPVIYITGSIIYEVYKGDEEPVTRRESFSIPIFNAKSKY